MVDLYNTEGLAHHQNRPNRIPIATVAAFTSKYRREVLKETDCDHVTVAFFGDDTCNNGQFFECLNMAALWKLNLALHASS